MKPLFLFGCLATVVVMTTVTRAEPMTRFRTGSHALRQSGAESATTAADASKALHYTNEGDSSSGFSEPELPLHHGLPSYEQEFLPGEGAIVEPCFGQPSCPPRPLRYAFAEYLYWTATNRLLDYAISDTIGAAAISGDTHSLEYEAEAGVRAGFAYQTSGGWDARFSYTGLESSDQQATTGFLFATLSHPAFNVVASEAEAIADLDYDVLDLEFGHSFLVTEACRLRLHGGLRGARIDQALEARYDGIDFSNGFVARSQTFEGLGLRAGVEGTWLICYGVGLFGRMGGSILAGDLESRAVETDDLGLIVDVNNSSQEIVTATELALGVSWQGRHWQLQCGYEITSWHNLSQRVEFHDDVHVASFSRSQDSLGLHGAFGRAAYCW